MWFFKKKKVEPKVEPKYKVKENRFYVTVDRDRNNYMIKVYDMWSSTFFRKNGKEKDILHCQESTMQNCNYEEVLKLIEESKNLLRGKFIKKRNMQCKPKKKKIEKKKVIIK